VESLRKTKKRGHTWCRRRRNRIHAGKEDTRQCKTNSRHKTANISEVAHKNMEKHFQGEPRTQKQGYNARLHGRQYKEHAIPRTRQGTFKKQGTHRQGNGKKTHDTM
jgi:hypothetical protein